MDYAVPNPGGIAPRVRAALAIQHTTAMLYVLYIPKVTGEHAHC